MTFSSSHDGLVIEDEEGAPSSLCIDLFYLLTERKYLKALSLPG